jgi:hypothetical protein|uniref:SsDNA binding protein n=1 Tax=Podoviridae sp. ctEmK1 TaxID=2827727 RepID=A0A8S5S5D1_9CAUD|nr:MAG TPA: ssDNA binding protein [Podoviridae sp. ctEmK1]
MNKITITNASREFTEVEQYLMTMDAGIISMKDVADGESIPVDAYLEYKDTKNDGTEAELLSIITVDGKVYSTQSATFKSSLKSIHELMHGKPYAIVKRSGETKAGRAFVDCGLDVNSVK